MQQGTVGPPEAHPVLSFHGLKQFVKPVAIRLTTSERMQEFAHRSAYFGRFHAWCVAHPCPTVSDRLELYELVARDLIGDGPLAYLEFGVFKGHTTRWWSDRSANAASTFVGFDSFEGLPERWGSMAAGTFSTNGNVPTTADSRVSFQKGWFSETVPPFMATFSKGGRPIVAHLDADLYSSTLLALLHLAPHLSPGDVLIFDEFADYMDEFRALQDAIHAYPFTYRAIAHTPEWTQLAIQVTAANG